jgi:ABC-type tungstate transport system substrate-binding protein
LLEVELGVIVAVTLVVTKVALVVVTAVALPPATTCKIRNAPRKSFICAAVKTAPAVKLAGRVVGVAIVLQ